MKHRKHGPYVLLVSCSWCKEDFQDNKARYLLGSYPLEQFCRYSCAENYLENGRGLTRAIPLTPRADAQGDFWHFEKRADQSHPATK